MISPPRVAGSGHENVIGELGEGQDYATVAYDAITGEQIQVARYDGPAGWDAANALAVGPDGSLYVTGESASRHYRDYGTIRYVLE